MSKEGEIEWVHCNECLRPTQHEVLMVRQTSQTEPIKEIGDEIEWQTVSVVLECRGCGSVCLRQHLLSDWDHDETEYFPPPIARQRPQWRYRLDENLQELLDESYSALQAGSRRLALMGARALVDLYMTARVGDVGGFQKKLDQLVGDGYLSVNDRTTLEAALDAGHAATHRGHKPNETDVTLVFDIVENLLHAFAIEKDVEKLQSRTPKRRR